MWRRWRRSSSRRREGGARCPQRAFGNPRPHVKPARWGQRAPPRARRRRVTNFVIFLAPAAARKSLFRGNVIGSMKALIIFLLGLGVGVLAYYLYTAQPQVATTYTTEPAAR